MGADLAILNKERPAQEVDEISYVIGNVRDKTALLVDDMITTAGTLAAAAQAADVGAPSGSSSPRRTATSPVTPGRNLAVAEFEQVVVTDIARIT